jgi:hypothetical protein
VPGGNRPVFDLVGYMAALGPEIAAEAALLVSEISCDTRIYNGSNNFSEGPLGKPRQFCRDHQVDLYTTCSGIFCAIGPSLKLKVK